ncbi:MAG: tRNA (adenosine(37)-N6)-dimethylallyltransferase MiaA [Syntrophomonadaceae bacterium]|nr:tRNA (adenosine(37)-N6)-dimethylallyltransferase MiaA [Syntrophomonadaceae bacterium]
MLNLAAIVGPTAVGKSSIAIEVALKLDGEIISCDSMQVYKGMDIGTAKVSKEKRKIVPHHLVDVVEADQPFSVAEYQSICKQLIKKLNTEGKLPILVGGTGLYYQSVVDDYDFFPMETVQEVREKWNRLIDEKGLDFVYKRLKAIDEDYAAKISPNDRKRIVRALEVYEITGRPFSDQQTKTPNAYNLAVVGLYLERQELYARIDARVEEMLQKGLIEEVQGLRLKGYDLSLNSMQALGYKEVYLYLEGLVTKDEMINEIKRETRRYAKRQYTWFNKDRRIYWINITDYPNESSLAEKISRYLEGQLFHV